MLSNNDGIVVAASPEAKALGLVLGVPIFQAEDIVKVEQVLVFSSNYTLYGDISARVMQTLARFSPDMEVYSIDEAFLNLSHFSHHDLTAYGHEIRDTVLRWTGIPVSIGIAETKTLAKIANRFAKRSPKTKGVLNMAGSPWRDEMLARTEVADIWGVGPRYSAMLRRNDIITAYDLARADDVWVRKHMTVMGLRTVHELRGIPSIEFELIPSSKQQICVSKSFGRAVRTLSKMEEAVASYTARAAEKLRSEGSAAGSVMVFMYTNRFKDEPQYVNTAMTGLSVATDITDELISAAMSGARRIYKQGYRYQKCGVVLSDIHPANQIQLDLFDTRDRIKARRLMGAMDSLNNHYGTGMVKFAAEGIHKAWRTRFEKRSPRFTTRWEEIPVAKAM